MHLLIVFMALVLHGREKLVEIKDVVFIDSRCYTKKNTKTPFTGSIVVRDKSDRSLRSKTTYKNGMVNGPDIQWWQKDKIKSIKNFVNGKEQGEYIQYSASGKIVTHGQYMDGVESGTWYFYDKDGKIIDKKEYP